MTGFIGAGNMANAIIKGMVSSGAQEGKDIAVYDIHPEKREKAAADYGVNAMSSLEELVSECSEIVVAIKPYGFEKLLGGLDSLLKERDPLIISIAAGKTLEAISSYLGYEPALARVMPNINATIGESVSAYCANGRVTAEQKAFVAKLCSSIGETVELDEKFFSAFGVIGGAAPAFVYMFIDELARGGVKIGMNKQVALKVAAQTVLGSAKMIAGSGEHPYALVDKVCSPGGTTVEGVAALNENGFANAVMQAVTAVYEKDLKLSGKEDAERINIMNFTEV